MKEVFEGTAKYDSMDVKYEYVAFRCFALLCVPFRSVPFSPEPRKTGFSAA